MTKFTRKFLTHDIWHTHLLIALGSLTWAILLGLPSDLFSRPTYFLMAALMPEWVWATLFAIHAGAAYLALRYNDFHDSRKNIPLFILDGFLGMLLWTSSTLLCFAAHWPKTGSWIDQIIAYPPPAAMSGELWVAIYAWVYFVLRGSDIIKDK